MRLSRGTYDRSAVIVDPITGTKARVLGGSALMVINQPYSSAIAEGDIEGHVPFYHKGFSPAASAASTTLWNPATAYVFPTVAQQMRVISTSVNDTSAGTGARTVHLYYLDTNYEEQDEIITLNGTGAVLTVATDILRVNYFHLNTAGALGATAGVVSLQNTAGTVAYSQIAATQTVSRCSVYTVPLGKSLYISDVTFSAAYSTAGKSERMTLHASLGPNETTPSTSGTIFWPYSEIVLVDSAFTSSSSTVLKFPAKTDIKVSVAGETNAICTSELRGWLE